MNTMKTLQAGYIDNSTASCKNGFRTTMTFLQRIGPTEDERKITPMKKKNIFVSKLASLDLAIEASRSALPLRFFATDKRNCYLFVITRLCIGDCSCVKSHTSQIVFLSVQCQCLIY